MPRSRRVRRRGRRKGPGLLLSSRGRGPAQLELGPEALVCGWEISILSSGQLKAESLELPDGMGARVRPKEQRSQRTEGAMGERMGSAP